jgi:aspartate/tyrosine/aromatic aminotransferase
MIGLDCLVAHSPASCFCPLTINTRIGMFAFTGLDPSQCQRLTEEFSIFLTTNGRISVAGLNPGNLSYVANAIHAVSMGQTVGGEMRTGKP